MPARPEKRNVRAHFIHRKNQKRKKRARISLSNEVFWKSTNVTLTRRKKRQKVFAPTFPKKKKASAREASAQSSSFRLSCRFLCAKYDGEKKEKMITGRVKSWKRPRQEVADRRTVWVGSFIIEQEEEDGAPPPLVLTVKTHRAEDNLWVTRVGEEVRAWNVMDGVTQNAELVVQEAKKKKVPPATAAWALPPPPPPAAPPEPFPVGWRERPKWCCLICGVKNRFHSSFCDLCGLARREGPVALEHETTMNHLTMPSWFCTAFNACLKMKRGNDPLAEACWLCGTQRKEKDVKKARDRYKRHSIFWKRLDAYHNPQFLAN